MLQRRWSAKSIKDTRTRILAGMYSGAAVWPEPSSASILRLHTVCLWIYLGCMYARERLVHEATADGPAAAVRHVHTSRYALRPKQTPRRLSARVLFLRERERAEGTRYGRRRGKCLWCLLLLKFSPTSPAIPRAVTLSRWMYGAFHLRCTRLLTGVVCSVSDASVTWPIGLHRSPHRPYACTSPR